MRHLGSLVLSLLLGAAAWLLTGFGITRYGVGWDDRTNVPDRDLLLGLLALAVAGALYALLVLARLSPVGPVLAGLGILGFALWWALAPGSFADVLPESVLRQRGTLRNAAGPHSVALAVPLILTILSPRRWRRRERPVPPGGSGQPSPVPMGPAPHNQPAYAHTAAPTFGGPAYPPARPPSEDTTQPLLDDTRPLPDPSRAPSDGSPADPTAPAADTAETQRR